MVASTAPALRIAPESHVHPSLRAFFDDAEIVRRTLAVLPPAADPDAVHVVSWRAKGKQAQTALHRVREEDVTVLGVRGARTVPSRLVLGVKAPYTSTVTVVVGPHEGVPTIFTAYWGAPAPREPGDPSLDDAGRAEAKAFWRAHALVPEPGEHVVINLTPHEIVAGEGPDARRFPASGLVARVTERAVTTGRVVAGQPVYRVEYGEVEDLPAPQSGVTFLASGMVRSALGATRPDVLAPYDLVRDEKGRIIGCRGFVGVEG